MALEQKRLRTQGATAGDESELQTTSTGKTKKPNTSSSTCSQPEHLQWRHSHLNVEAPQIFAGLSKESRVVQTGTSSTESVWRSRAPGPALLMVYATAGTEEDYT